MPVLDPRLKSLCNDANAVDGLLFGPDFQKLLREVTENIPRSTVVNWCSPGLLQGYCRMPYIFTKVLKVPLGVLRSHSVQAVIYLDDIFLTQPSRVRLQENIHLTVFLLEQLAFTLNVWKRVLAPVQEI
ncbi:reverse transcriptase/ribonuclease h/methyltransferase [Elysia marginata]|uniref:Reverse transcriptase/ribonuclease h/methyltransferase n=1 Tax=Elysia marginata TaxID=1093978 RepID=A0AAV4G3N3_9GAST|nr:reverse transcriptase/ribonuclease h/methyltransferase [Elysia marginata]